ncbi:MAG: tRNA 4-thiouridine(8) synthase ThiI [Desulfobacterales bacterium]|nr:MAG: tRNA 4-thiouridine(8) synthase ThiI [Desulfobacterales bacterium]
MKTSKKKARALGLCSGGLDSILSALVLKAQGVNVMWVSFETPFFSSTKARQASKNTGIPIVVQNITPDYLKMLKNPPCGYGKYMNPCMDCHALMFRLAGAIMKENNLDFLFSGEVLGQRPMSQNKQSLRYVEKQSGFDGYILRPLSAKKLPETIPESAGIVDRNRLLGISGRSRKPQIQLAKEFGIEDYPSPAGGCLLTDKSYAARLKDLFDHQDSYAESEYHLLKYGRHLRLDNKTKIIVGRTHKDNENIKRYYTPHEDTLIKVINIPGPTVLMPHGGSKEMTILSASICTGYSKAPDTVPVDVKIVTPHGHEVIKVVGIPPKSIRHFLI